MHQAAVTGTGDPLPRAPKTHLNTSTSLALNLCRYAYWTAQPWTERTTT